MLKDQCISVTELKKNANTYLKSLDKEKIIFVNNKPIAVLMNIDDYEDNSWTDFKFERPIEMGKFYDIIKNDGRKMA